jgi:hypothetical protein
MNTEALLVVIYTASKRADVVPAYRRGIVDNPTGTREGRPTIDWEKVNRAITERWSSSALTWIKTQAWKQR